MMHRLPAKKQTAFSVLLSRSNVSQNNRTFFHLGEGSILVFIIGYFQSIIKTKDPILYEDMCKQKLSEQL